MASKLRASRPLSLSHLTIGEVLPPDVPAVAAATGFDSISLRLNSPRSDAPSPPMIGDTAMRRATRRSLSDNGMRLLNIEAVLLRPDTDRQLRCAIRIGGVPGRGGSAGRRPRCGRGALRPAIPGRRRIPVGAVGGGDTRSAAGRARDSGRAPSPAGRVCAAACAARPRFIHAPVRMMHTFRAGRWPCCSISTTSSSIRGRRMPRAWFEYSAVFVPRGCVARGVKFASSARCSAHTGARQHAQ